MIPRIFAVLAALATMFTAGCVSAELSRTVAEIDRLAEEIVASPVPAGDDTDGAAGASRALGPAALLAAAERRGPDFLDAQLRAAQARIELDRRKSGMRPRLSVGLRQRLTVLGPTPSVLSEPDAFFGLDWDLISALLALDRSAIEVAEELIPVQTALDLNQARDELFAAWFDYGEAVLRQRELDIRRAGAQCRRAAGAVELALGTIDPARADRLAQLVAAIDRQRIVARQSTESARRQVLHLAGLPETAQVSDAGDPATILPSVPRGVSRAQCYARSGNATRDGLLLAGAAAGLRAARLGRLGRFDLFLPTEVTPTAGLNLDLLAALVVPLIDQGDATRRVQEARLALLGIALSGERNRRYFDLSLSTIATERAAADVAVLDARDRLRTPSDLPEPTAPAASEDRQESCDARMQQDLAQLDIARAELRERRARTRLALLCAPGPATGRDPDTLRREAFAAAVRSQK